jgi:hypothetical protein
MSITGMQRLSAQRIAQATFQDAGGCVAWLGAMQGQDYLGAKWSIGLRLSQGTDRAVEEAIVQGTIRRSWLLRGTLHFVAAADLHWMLALLAPRLIAGNAGRYKQLELDESTLTRSTTLITEALSDGIQRTRSELFEILEHKGISTAGQRGVYLAQRAALEKLIYQGPVIRNETTFRLLEPGSSRPKEEAVAELARRYFMSHGPTTLNEFAAWSGLTLTDARLGLGAVRAELAEGKIDGASYFFAPELSGSSEASVYLLPGFDEFVLGYRDRSAILESQFADAICPGGNGMFTPTVVSGGRIVGTWKRTLKKKGVEIALSPFHTFSPDEHTAIAAAAERYGAFLGLAVKIVA